MKPTFDEAKERAEQRGDEYIYGAIGRDIAAVPLADRLRYLPIGIPQFNSVMDTNGCASRGPVNIAKAKFTWLYHNGMDPVLKEWLQGPHYIDGRPYSYVVGEGPNAQVVFDETFIEILSGTKPNGNSLKAPVHTLYERGLIPECLPLEKNMTWEEYTDPKRITQALLDLGLEFKRRFPMNYEQVPLSRFEEATHDDYLDVALHAWPLSKDGIYPANNGAFNHVVARATNVIHAFDNYNPFLKQLAPDYKFFDWAYSLSVVAQNPQPIAPASRPALVAILVRLWQLARYDLFAALWKAIFAPPPQVPVAVRLVDRIHTEALSALGTDASPQNLAPQELSCAEGVSNIVNRIDPAFPEGIVSTTELARILDVHDNYERTKLAQPGCIIVSPRVGKTPGHAGFMTHGQRIISNDSKTGTMQNNYSLDTWAKEMRERRGLKIYIWKPL